MLDHEELSGPAEGDVNVVRMGEDAPTTGETADQPPARPVRKRATRAKKVAPGPESAEPVGTDSSGETVGTAVKPVAVDPLVEGEVAQPKKAPAKKAAAKKAPSKKSPSKKSPATKSAAEKAPSKKVAAKKAVAASVSEADLAGQAEAPVAPGAKRSGSKAAAAGKPKKKAAAKKTAPEPEAETEEAAPAAPAAATMVLFQAPVVSAPVSRRRRKPVAEDADEPLDEATGDAEPSLDEADETSDENGESADEAASRRRPRRRGGRRRRRTGDSDGEANEAADDADTGDGEAETEDATEAGSRRRRRRRRSTNGDDNGAATAPRTIEDEITAVSGSTRLEAKKQRRREGREAGRRRAPIVSEAEFLARRESVDRVMVIRQREELTQIAVLEDNVLVEHYVARESQTSMIGNVYLGRVQNVLPSMEAAFIDIGKGRNAVLYAGEVNWQALGHPDGQPRKIESVLTPGQPVLVQVTKDPIGHKGARLTSQISLPGRFLVYVPDGTTSGISRKLPDTERNRLKVLLKEIVPDTAGVIVRTAAEGASEEELTRDVERLTARWADIEAKVAAGRAPELLYGEPDLTLKVVRDLFTEDFTSLVIQGDDAWDLVDGYVSHVAPDLGERLHRFVPSEDGAGDVFASYRVDEQIAKGLDRKVWLPSGGSLVIDRTEAMTVVDVNTGKFTGSGGNLEETVTKNNLEAAEETVRQLRLRDIGGIIVIDFIDMVLESNRDLVLRRLVECLGRDRTRHQVAEVTSLGLVQMTRKRIGTGLLESFSEDCEHCKGRGVVVHEAPVEPAPMRDEPVRSRRGRSRTTPARPTPPPMPSPRDLATAARPDNGDAAVVEPLIDPAAAEAPEVVADQPTVEASAAEAAPVAVARAEGELAAVAPEPAAEPAPEPTTPVIKTTTRRRGARRAAGPPVAGPPVAMEAPVVDAPVVEQALVEDVDSEHRIEEPLDAVADAPAVADAAVAADPAVLDDTEAVAMELEESAGVEGVAGMLHVPIKRKGARKR